jgi:hypothetical protein
MNCMIFCSAGSKIFLRSSIVNDVGVGAGMMVVNAAGGNGIGPSGGFATGGEGGNGIF